MADKSGIEWTRGDDGTPGATWNPVTGCTKVSPGCGHCYAETFAERWRGIPGHHFENGFDITLRPERLDQPKRWTRPRRIFVNSMSDLFHEKVPDGFIAAVFDTMAVTPQHTFLVLTKRHGRMRSLLNRWAEDRFYRRFFSKPDIPLDGPLPNVWLGVSVEDQKWAGIRIPALLNTPAAVRFLSCEPLLGPLNLRPMLIAGRDFPPPDSIDWVIAGGESGPGARPMHPDWPRRIRDDCSEIGVPFFFKQWGEWGPLAPTDSQGRITRRGFHSVANDGTVYAPGEIAWPDGPRWGEAIRARHDHAHLTAMYRVGKKAAGHELDGQVWQQFPQSKPTVPAA